MHEADERLVLLIDDDPAQVRRLSTLASRAGWRVRNATSASTAIAQLREGEGRHPSAIILDGWVAGDDSCQLIGQLNAISPHTPIVFITASASPLMAVEAMRAGASDFLTKPVASERLLYALESSGSCAGLRDELAPLTEKIDAPLDFEMMIGSAPNFRAALARAAKAARNHGPMLIAGEPGTGKELLARAVHSASPRSRSSLHILQVSGVAPGHLGSALYGHERNAFPGAFARREGALREASGGTLLIDDVEQLPASVQVRLAQTVKTGRAQPLGAAYDFQVDVRIIATSCADLEMLRQQGRIEPELAAVLEKTVIELPPLRERTGDIAPLARHFLARIGEQPGLRRLGITDDATDLLGGYGWPGNLRQLQAALFRAAVFSENDALTAQDFPQLADIVGESVRPSRASGGITLYDSEGHLRTLEEIEADVIRLAIGHYRGRMSEVARRLGIGRSTLYRKLGDLGIDNAA